MYDTIIVGAGPVGLYAAYYLQSKGIKVCLLEANHQVGGQLTSMYPEKSIVNLPGVKEIKAQDYINDLVNQLDSDNIIHLNQKVMSVTKDGEVFIVSSETDSFTANSVIIATGNGELKPRPLGVEDEDKIENIIYAITDLKALEQQDVVIFGGGDSAIDWALHLEPIAKHVSVIHRRNEFRALASSVEQLRQTSASIYTPHSLVNYEVNDNKITSLVIEDKESKEKITLNPDYVICNFGFVYEKNVLEQWGIDIVDNKVVVDRKQASNLEGIFAIGDACSYESKNYNILTGLGEASVVANNVINYLATLECNKDRRLNGAKNY